MPSVLWWIIIKQLSLRTKFDLWNTSYMPFWLQSKLEVGGWLFWGWMEIELHAGNKEWYFVQGHTVRTREKHYLGRVGDARSSVWDQNTWLMWQGVCDDGGEGSVVWPLWANLVAVFAEEESREVKQESKAAVWVCETKAWVRRVWNRRQIWDLHPSPKLAPSLRKVIKYPKTKYFKRGKLTWCH